MNMIKEYNGKTYKLISLSKSDKTYKKYPVDTFYINEYNIYLALSDDKKYYYIVYIKQ